VLQAKQTVLQLLDRLPDDCSLDDVIYQLHVVQAVKRGRADVAAGRTVPQEQVAEQLCRKWR
jgi:predicted transcriptional regulator